MKTVTLFLSAFIISLNLISQNGANYLSVESGDIKDAKGILKSVEQAYLLPSGKIDIIVVSNGNCLIYQKNPIDKSEKNTKVLTSFSNSKVFFLSCFLSESQLYFLFATNDKKEKKKSLWLIRYNGETLEQVSGPKCLYQSEFYEPNAMLNQMGGQINSGLSALNSGLTGYYIMQNEENDCFVILEFVDLKENSDFTTMVHLMDVDMEETASYKTFCSTNTTPMTNGNDVVLIDSYEDINRFNIMFANPKTPEPKEINFENNNFKFICCKSISNDERIFLTGFYTDMENKLKGVYSSKIDVQLGIALGFDFYELDKEFINETIVTSSRKIDMEFAKIKINSSTIEMPDGGFCMIGQIIYEQNDYISNIEYYNSDLFVIRSNNIGEIMWVRKLPRYLHSYCFGRYAGIIAFENNGDVFVVYNDDERNLTSVNNNVYETSLRSKYAITTIARISPDGEVNRNVLFRYSDLGAVTDPVQSMVSESGKFLIFHYSELKAVKYSVVTLNEL